MAAKTANLEAPKPSPGSGESLEVRILKTGDDLLKALGAALKAMPERGDGPQALAARLQIDKVLASRMLKALRAADPISAVHRMPGPEPLRRVLRAMSDCGVSEPIVRRASDAVDRYDRLIRQDIGDRSSLDAIVSAWVPDARREFELRRKQAAFRAISQLKGSEAAAILATVLLHPSADGTHLDVVWLNGLFGLQRLRPGAGVKLATRRMDRDPAQRAPTALDGTSVDDPHAMMLREFCSSPLPALNVQRTGPVVHYSLASESFGPGSGVDLVFAEVNRAEINRYATADPTRKGYVFAETSVAAGVLQFDALLHEDVFPGSNAALRIYDTALEGVANVNDRSRDIDQLDLMESVEPLGLGMSRFRSADVPRYSELLRTVCDAMSWDERRFRGYRCRINYPVYGSQVAMMFDLPRAPEALGA